MPLEDNGAQDDDRQAQGNAANVVTRDPFTAGYVEVDLPDAGKVRGVRPTLPDLIRQGLLPDNLRTVALHFADPSWFVSDDDTPPDVLAQRSREHVETVHLLVARFITHTWDDDAGTWQPYDRPIEERLALLPSPTSPGGMSALDYDLLEDVVLGIRTGAEASGVTERIRQGLPPQEAVAADTLDATFRGVGDGPADRQDGGGVGRPIARDHLPRRARRRTSVPVGRGHGATTVR
jgi:hypothetical protein